MATFRPLSGPPAGVLLTARGQPYTIVLELRGKRGAPRIVESCPHGHPYSEENTRWAVKQGKRYRVCRACSRATPAYREAKRLANARRYRRKEGTR